MSSDGVEWKLLTIARSGVVSLTRFGTKAEAERGADAARGVDRSAPPIEVVGYDAEAMCILVKDGQGQAARLLPRSHEPWDIMEARVFQ